MKKFVCLLVIVGVLGFIAFTPAEAGANGRWVLYDDFDSGTIETNLWYIDDSSATIEIIGNQLKITHNWSENDSNGLIFKVNPERLKAVKMRIMVESISGNLQARIGGYIGEEQDGSRIFKRLAIRRDGSGRERLDCWAGEDPYNRYLTEFINTVRSGDFIEGEWFEIGMNFHRWISKCWIEDFRKDFYFFRPHLLPPAANDAQYKYIGTRSLSGGGSAVVWIDDVYVQY